MTRARVAIVGAGAGGLCMAMQLARSGERDFVVLERWDGVGGTWRANAYPGAACDVPSHLYSFSFAPRAAWSRVFAPQAEILTYLEACAERYGLGPHLRFGAEVRSAEWKGDRWHLELADGSSVEAQVVVWALGQLSRPRLPDIEGLDRFAGPCFHSARWDRAADLTGRVGVVGNAASAVQIVPELAQNARSLTVFQRSAHWVLPRPDRAYTTAERWAFAHVPGVRLLHRARIFAALEARFVGFRAGSVFNRLAEVQARRHLATVRDPELRRRLTPDYPPGCKRVLLSSDYYPTLALPHVQLVDAPITAATAAGLEAGGTHELDAIVLATGFDTAAPLGSVRVTGRSGTLAEAWRSGPFAHLGMAVPGFPNLYLLYGPNTNLGHNSILAMLECQVAYVLQALEHEVLEVRPEVAAAWDAGVQEALRDTVWSEGCGSWYVGEDGRISTNWSGTVTAYWRRTRTLRRADYIDA